MGLSIMNEKKQDFWTLEDRFIDLYLGFCDDIFYQYYGNSHVLFVSELVTKEHVSLTFDKSRPVCGGSSMHYRSLQKSLHDIQYSGLRKKEKENLQNLLRAVESGEITFIRESEFLTQYPCVPAEDDE